MMDAKDVVFTTIEMEICWREAKRAHENYLEKLDTYNQKIKGKTSLEIQSIKFDTIVCGDPKTLDEFTNVRLNAFAEVSHGDVVLKEDKELMRIPGKYKKDKVYKADKA